MSYETPDRAWAEMELNILKGMGRKWFLNNPPKIWKLPERPDNLMLEGMKKRLRDEGFKFKSYTPFAHRYMRDLVSEKHKIIIHHWAVSQNERNLMKVLGYRFFLYYKNRWRLEIERIIKELKGNANEPVAR